MSEGRDEARENDTMTGTVQALTDETEQELRSGIRDLCRKYDDAYWAVLDEAKEFPWDFYNDVAKGGWLGIGLPEQYGGGGLGVGAAGVVLEEIAESGAGMNGCSAVHLGIFGLLPLVKHGGAELKDRFLPRMAAGDLHVSFAVTEPDAGTDTTQISTTAKPTAEGYRISGKKVWITKAQQAERILLLARTTPLAECARRTEGLSLFFVEVDRQHIDIRPIPKMGRNAVNTNELFIDGLEVPHTDLVGEEGRGFQYLLAGLNAERILVAHEAIGIGRAALRRAVTYGNERVVFGRPIGKNQGIQFPLADALARLDAAELMTRKAARLYDTDQRCGREANTAKYLAAEACFLAADRAVQTHGGFGYAQEYHVERYFREARLLRLVPVSQEMVLNYLGEHVLGLPRSY